MNYHNESVYFKNVTFRTFIQEIKTFYSDSLDDLKVERYTEDKEKWIALVRIVVNKSSRGKGIGSEIISMLLRYADFKQYKVCLFPSSDLGGDISKLIPYYERFGFKLDKLSDSNKMIYTPKK